MKTMNRSLWLLALCQGLFLTNNVVFIAINGLVGLSLAPASWMATLPVMGYVVGGALSTGIVARVQARYGRQFSFQSGLMVAIASAALCAVAAQTHQFWLLVGATVLAGYYSANGQLYRFAAAELVTAEHRDNAISWVLAGGLLGAVLGPNLAKWTRNALDVPFAGAYVALVLVALLSMLVMAGVRFAPPQPRPAGTPAPGSTGRPLLHIMRQPIFIVAAAGSALGYGVMNLLMAATPLAMQVCGLGFDDAAFVLQWHVIGMFAPGFFTGHLIKRWGALPIMAVGLLLNVLCVAIALSGTGLEQFVAALFVLGVGWNFLFTGSTTLSMTAWTPEEKDRGQAAINFCVFAVMAVTSFASGALLTSQGWAWLNRGSSLPLVLLALALSWLAWLRRTHRRGIGAN
jgi:predicted MFS family arabinose efflux permease